MTDKYMPSLSEFTLTEAEKALLLEALATADPWGWEPDSAKQLAIKTIKDKIRSYHLQRHNYRCCYCRKILHGEGHFAIDREHILPKFRDNFKPLSFEIWNLGASCKRCNMEYKKDKIDFIVNPDDPQEFQSPENYLLIHPNYDLYKDHIIRKVNQDDEEEIMVVKYTVKKDSQKGDYTYKYFNLRGLEIDSFDRSQGLVVKEELGKISSKAQEIAEESGM